MARMIPASYDDSTTSSAERRIFSLLRDDPDTASWTVLHSLGLSERADRRYGEIDFVALVPGAGIICLEVKGGRVSCRDGIWYTENRYGERSQLKRSPFMQAREGMFALKNAIADRFGKDDLIARCPVGYAVVFPDVPVPPLTPEFDRSEAIGSDELRRPVSRALQPLIKRQLGSLRTGRPAGYPMTDQLSQIRQFLRPDFERVIARPVTIGRTENDLLKLTEEQYARLDELQENPRCLFEGAAGTGKTLLALEFARRTARAGRRTLLICYNRLLGTWLESQVAESALECLCTGTFHSCLRAVILASDFAGEFRERERSQDPAVLFGETYPFYGELAFEASGPLADTLVIDEAQDLLRRPVLDILNRWLSGGLAGGHWAIFGDFTRQALYGSEGMSPAVLEDYCAHYTKARLTLNCRNTRRIVEETVLLSGFDAPPYRVAQVEGLPVEYHYWQTPDDEACVLAEVLERLLVEGVQPADIIVLSPKRWSSSVASRLGRIRGVPVLEAGPEAGSDPLGRAVRWATVQAFKGMESSVVVVTDLDIVDPGLRQSLLYVAMSRARSHLVLVVHESIRRAVAEGTRRRLTEDRGR